MYDDLKNNIEHSYQGNIFDNYLMPDEVILWQGKYNKGGGVKSFASAYNALFSIFWIVFSVFWTVFAFIGGGLFGLFGIPFILIGVYLIKSSFGGRKNSYAITNMRVMTYDSKIFTSDMLCNVINISFSQGKNNIGNVNFDIAGKRYERNRNNLNGLVQKGFYGVENPQEVFNILNQAVIDYVQCK